MITEETAEFKVCQGFQYLTYATIEFVKLHLKEELAKTSVRARSTRSSKRLRWQWANRLASFCLSLAPCLLVVEGLDGQASKVCGTCQYSDSCCAALLTSFCMPKLPMMNVCWFPLNPNIMRAVPLLCFSCRSHVPQLRSSLSVTTFPMVLRSSLSTSTQSYMASERFAELANVRTVVFRLSAPRFACPVSLESQRCARSGAVPLLCFSCRSHVPQLRSS